MNTANFLNHVEKLYVKCIGVLIKKNADYSASSDNPFRNFELVEHLGLTTSKVGILTRVSDKISRISQLLQKNPDVVEESLQDSIEDAINYLAILHAKIASENEITQ